MQGKCIGVVHFNKQVEQQKTVPTAIVQIELENVTLEQVQALYTQLVTIVKVQN